MSDKAPSKKPPKPRPRRAGRPSGDDRDLRVRLIDAAIGQFTRNGVRATSLRAIATDAGVTPAMLHYYFGYKEQMVQAVVEDRLLPALASMRELLATAGDDPAVLAAEFVRGMSDVVARHPWLPPLWVREVVCEGGALREVLFTRGVPHGPQLLAQKFAQAQAQGRLDPELDPRLLVVSLVGLTLFPAAGAPIWRRMFASDELGTAAMQSHTLALIEHGIGAAARARKRSRS